MTSTTSAPGSPQEAIEVRTENLFQRTEVLAGMYYNLILMDAHHYYVFKKKNAYTSQPVGLSRVNS